MLLLSVSQGDCFREEARPDFSCIHTGVVYCRGGVGGPYWKMFSTTLQFGVTSLFRGSYATWCTLDYCISPCIALRYDLLLARSTLPHLCFSTQNILCGVRRMETEKPRRSRKRARFAQGVSTPASGPRTPRTSSDPQTPPLRKQQQQQQSRQGGGRDDGGRSSRVGSMLAVERQAVMPGEGLVESMDVFSLGCVIAEVCLFACRLAFFLMGRGDVDVWHGQGDVRFTDDDVWHQPCSSHKVWS